MPFKLPDLPFAYDALAPHMSKETLQFHHDKHHKAYVDKLNAAIEGTRYADMTLDDIIRASAKTPQDVGVFNNAAQHWNHTFFWNCLTPKGGGKPEGELAARIEADFGGYDDFAKAFKAAATGQFGSGWAWLVLDGDDLKVTATPNAELPLMHGQEALLTCDVWEHAYYLDYQNRRPDFVDTVLQKLVNWRYVAERLAEAEPIGETADKVRAAGGRR
jgi:Fe-Mn family superoxide dismutase